MLSGVGERGRRNILEVRDLAARKTKKVEALRRVAVLPSAVVGAYMSTFVADQIGVWILGSVKFHDSDAAAIALVSTVVTTALLIAAWVAPRTRFATAVTLWMLLALPLTYIYTLPYTFIEANRFTGVILMTFYASGALACLLIWGMWAREQAA